MTFNIRVLFHIRCYELLNARGQFRASSVQSIYVWNILPINANASNPYLRIASFRRSHRFARAEENRKSESRTRIARARYECSATDGGAYISKVSWFIKVATITGCILFKREELCGRIKPGRLRCGQICSH